MSEMVERVALALRGVEMKLPGAGGLRGTLCLAPAQAREYARAAIEAMREPTEGMLDAAREVTKGQSFFADYPRKIDARVHRAMIDAALKEPTPTA